MICIIGLPNAGKTTYSTRYDNVLHTDALKPKARWSDIEKAMDDSLVVDGVFFSRRTREKLLALADGCKKTCIWLDTPVDVCINRENRGRHHSLVEVLHMRFEPPTLDEGWDEIIRIKYNAEE